MKIWHERLSAWPVPAKLTVPCLNFALFLRSSRNVFCCHFFWIRGSAATPAGGAACSRPGKGMAANGLPAEGPGAEGAGGTFYTCAHVCRRHRAWGHPQGLAEGGGMGLIYNLNYLAYNIDRLMLAIPYRILHVNVVDMYILYNNNFEYVSYYYSYDHCQYYYCAYYEYYYY